MWLNLKRFWRTSDFTIGYLYIDGKPECFTLEDPERETKLESRTAIPCGTYKVIINESPKFKKLMPRLLDVPNFDGILIHCGNTTADTEGCILVGNMAQYGYIGNSRLTYAALFDKIKDIKDLIITVEDI
jgi:hypothetical protein